MQKTEKYQFNLIEADDTFSADPLNENMEKVEAQLEAARAEAQMDDGALASRISVLEAHRISVGGFRPSETSAITINVGFYPKAIIVISANLIRGAILRPGGALPYGVTLTATGFQVQRGSEGASSFCDTSSSYNYIAFC